MVLKILAVILVGALAEQAMADVAFADVEFDENGAVAQSLTGTAGNAEEGSKIFGDKTLGNCVACHQVASNPADFQGDIGPVLNDEGNLRSEAELRGIVIDAKHTFPDTMMPSMYKTSGYIRPGDAFTGKAGKEPLPPLLTGQQIEDVVAYLQTLKE